MSVLRTALRALRRRVVILPFVCALCRWLRADKVWVFEQQRGARVLTRFVRQRLERRALAMAAAEIEGDEPAQDGPAVSEQATEGTEGPVSTPSGVETSTPRKQLEAARDLDSALNLGQ